MYRRDIGQLARIHCCCCFRVLLLLHGVRAHLPVTCVVYPHTSSRYACIRLTTCNTIQTHRHMLVITLPDLQQYLCCTRIRRAVWVTGTRRANYGVWHTDRLRGTLQAAVDSYQSHLARLNNCCMLLRDITQQALTTYHRRVRCRVLSERPCMA